MINSGVSATYQSPADIHVHTHPRASASLSHKLSYNTGTTQKLLQRFMNVLLVNALAEALADLLCFQCGH